MTRCLSFAAAFVALMAVAAAQAPPAVIQPPADIQPPDISNGFFPPDTFMPDNTILPPIRPPILPPILPPIRPPAPICTPGEWVCTWRPATRFCMGSLLRSWAPAGVQMPATDCRRTLLVDPGGCRRPLQEEHPALRG